MLSNDLFPRSNKPPAAIVNEKTAVENLICEELPRRDWLSFLGRLGLIIGPWWLQVRPEGLIQFGR